MRYLALPLMLLATTPSIALAQDSLRDQVLTNGVTEEVVLVSYPALPLKAMTAAAGAIVHVSIRSSDTFLSSDGTAMLTDYRATVIDVLKDRSNSRLTAGEVMTIRRVGGQMQIEGRRVFSNESGFPAFSNGGDYVLFLKGGSGQPYEMLAGAQSAFRVDRGAVTPIAADADESPAVLMPLFVHDVRAQR